MGINNEYGYDAFQGDQYAYDDDYQEDEYMDLDAETWQDWHSDHLLNMWMSLRQYTEDNYLSSSLLCGATYPKFAEWATRHSDLRVRRRTNFQ
jgi:hypothetical protein